MPIRAIKEAIWDAFGSLDFVSKTELFLTADPNPGFIGTVWDDNIYAFEETFGQTHKERVYQCLSKGGANRFRLQEEVEV